MTKFFYLFLAGISFVIPALAQTDDLKLFGYVAQSVVSSKGISVGGSENGNWSFDKRDITVFGDKSLPGLKANIRFAVGSTDEPGLDEHQLHVKYALIDKQWRVNDYIVGLRLGRVPHTLGFYNSTHNAPSVGQFVYLPEGIYREQFKWLAMSGDGGQLYWYHQFTPKFDIELTGTWTKAQLLANREVMSGHFNNPKIGLFDENKSEVRGITVESRYGSYKFYYNWINLYFWLKPEFPYSMTIPEGRADTNVHVIGVKKYMGPFEVTSEFMQVKTYGEVWDVIRAGTKQYGAPTGFILSGVWHATDKLDVSAYHSQYYTAVDDKSGKMQSKVAAMTGQNMPDYWFYVKSNSVAAKYQFNESWTGRVQYTAGEGVDPFIKTNVSDKKWSYIAAQIIYSF